MCCSGRRMFPFHRLRNSRVLALLLAASPLAAREKAEVIYAFPNYKTTSPIRMILVGEIKSKIKAAEIFDKDSPFQKYDTRLDQITVRVVNREGIKPGMKLYVIDKNPHHEKFRNGLITGEVVVESILNNPFYGLVLTGKGIFLRVKEGQFVARTLESESMEKALLIKKRGDALRTRGEIARAMAEYLKAVDTDRRLADAHAALGELYLDEARKSGEVPVRSLTHYRLAWKHRQHFDTKLDQFRFLTGFLQALRQGRRSSENRYAGEKGPPADLSDAVAAGEACMELSSHGDCRVETANAYFEMMLYYQGRGGSESRDRYDEFKGKTGKLLKELSSARFRRGTDHHEMLDYQNGTPLESESGVPVWEYHRLAMFYYDLLSRDPEIKASAASTDRMQQLVREHLKKFDMSYGADHDPDPEVESLRRRMVDDR